MADHSSISNSLGVPSSLPAAVVVERNGKSRYLTLDQPSPAANYLTSAIIDELALDKTRLLSFAAANGKS